MDHEDNLVRSGGALMEESSQKCYQHPSYLKVPDLTRGGRALFPVKEQAQRKQAVTSGICAQSSEGIPQGVAWPSEEEGLSDLSRLTGNPAFFSVGIYIYI